MKSFFLITQPLQPCSVFINFPKYFWLTVKPFVSILNHKWNILCYLEWASWHAENIFVCYTFCLLRFNRLLFAVRSFLHVFIGFGKPQRVDYTLPYKAPLSFWKVFIVSSVKIIYWNVFLFKNFILKFQMINWMRRHKNITIIYIKKRQYAYGSIWFNVARNKKLFPYKCLLKRSFVSNN